MPSFMFPCSRPQTVSWWTWRGNIALMTSEELWTSSKTSKTYTLHIFSFLFQFLTDFIDIEPTYTFNITTLLELNTICSKFVKPWPYFIYFFCCLKDRTWLKYDSFSNLLKFWMCFARTNFQVALYNKPSGASVVSKLDIQTMVLFLKGNFVYLKACIIWNFCIFYNLHVFCYAHVILWPNYISFTWHLTFLIDIEKYRDDCRFVEPWFLTYMTSC